MRERSISTTSLRRPRREWRISYSRMSYPYYQPAFLFSPFHRKLQRKLAELACFGLHRNPAIAFLDNAIHNAQAQSHAFADILGGKKRIKNFVEMLGVD